MTRAASFSRIVVTALAVTLAVAATVLVSAPAAWLGDGLQAQSRLRIVDPRGTLWHGSGMLAISDGERAMLLPGRLGWRLDRLALLKGRLAVTLEHPALGVPLIVTLDTGGGTLAAGRAELPAAALVALGAPFSTLRPGGALALRWGEMRVQAGLLTGSMEIEWRNAQSALSIVAPLGSFRLRLSGSGSEAAQLQLDTLRGPLRLQGTGTVKAGRLSFRGLASADPEMRHMLNGLLGVLGRRSGDNVVLSLET